MSEFDVRRASRLEGHIRARLDAGTLEGVTAGVWQNDKKLYGVCLGQSDPQRKKPMREDALFRLASMTKPVTGAMTMLQAERGLLQLDEPITRWLPGFAHMQVAVATPEGEILATRPAERPITPRMLLTHSSGLGSGQAGYTQYDKVFGPTHQPDFASAIDNYANCVLDFQPGSTQYYSATMAMDVLVRLVELTSGEPYADFVRRELFDPLEMPDTSYLPNAEQRTRLVRMVDARGGVLYPVDIPDECGFVNAPAGYTGGGAGLFSTLEDYSHLALMYLHGGEYRGRRILKPETVAEMASPQLPEEFAGLSRYFNWGLSMRVCPVQKAPGQPLSAGSFGWSGAFGTHFWVDPSKQLVAVYMSNLLDGGGAGAATAFEFERDVMAGFGECE